MWSRLLTSLGGGFTVLIVLVGLFAPKAPAQQPAAPQPVVAITTTEATTTTTTPTSTTPPTTIEPTTTTEPPTTTTEAAAPPPETHQQVPTTRQPAPPPSEPVFVTPGAFCSTEGATGLSKTGKSMVCTRTATDPRLRWRAA